MSNRPITCLIVEDSEMDRQLLRRVLYQLDPSLRHVVAGTLAEARAMLFAGKAGAEIDFILLDNSLPDGNGADFVMDLARDSKLSRIPVLIVTGWPSPFIFAKAKAAKVRDVVAKDQLRGKVVGQLFRECIEAAQAAQAARSKPIQTADLRSKTAPPPLTERQIARMQRDA